jgi:hypothetical protein
MTRPALTGAPLGTGRLPVQARDRRPALAALALLLVVAGALGAALVVYRSGQRTDVLVAAHEIRPGQRVTASDFTITRVSADSGTALAPASVKSGYVGTYATVDIPAGTLINRNMFQASDVLPSDGVVVGVSVTAAQQPAAGVHDGEVVRVYGVSKSDANSDTNGTALVDAARVVSVSSGSTGGASTVSLLLTSDSAPAVVSAAAQNDVVLGALPIGTKPAIDYANGS